MTIDPAILIFAVAAATLLVFLGIAMSVRTLLNPTRTARDRVADLTGTARAEDDLLFSQPAVKGVTSNIAALATPSNVDEKNLLRRRLLQAGYRDRNALEIFTAARTVLALLLPAFAFLLMPKMVLAYQLFVLLFSATLGYYLPGIWVTNLLQRRKDVLLKPFPDALDLLVSCVEAGLGLDAAFQRVAVEMEGAAPELARELQQVNNEAATGVTRIDALRHLDQRTGLEEVASLVNVLMQSERFGTSVARALRVHSDLVRRKRMLNAEENAAKISPKLTVAMILFILPCIMTVLIGPAMINVARNLMPMLNGQR